jgi:DNA-binding NarL/FixJ family response regulator
MAGLHARDKTRRTAVLCDPHPLWLDAVENVLAQLGVDVVARTTSPTDGIELTREHQPDLVVTEIAFDEEVRGFLRRIRSAAPEARTLVLAAVADTRMIEETLRAGAIAYVVKTSLPDDLASAIRQSFRPSVFLSAATLTANADRRTVDGGGREMVQSLTPREREILQLVAEGRPTAELAKELWVSQQTIKFHLSNIFRKLGVANRTEASRWAHVQGLLSGSAVSDRNLTAGQLTTPALGQARSAPQAQRARPK